MVINSLNDIWAAVSAECKKTISEVAFNCFLKDLTPVSLDNGVLVFSNTNEYMCTVIEQNYSEIIKEAVKNVMGIEVSIKVIFEDEEEKIEKAEIDNEGLSFEDFFTFENFIVGQSNQFAHAASLAVCENPGNTYNPLVIYGPSGVGKTHLMLAIKNKLKKRFPFSNILYTRSEDFTNQLIKALQEGKLGMGSINNFRNKYRNVDVLLIDDIHFIAGKESTQEEFFNTFNTLTQNGKQIVVTLDRSPKDVKTLEDRIRSRLEGGLLSDITPPDFETRVGIVLQMAEQSNIEIPENLVYYIAEQVKTNTRQLKGIVKKLTALVSIQHKTPTLSIVQGIIKEVISETKQEPIKIETIISEVAKTYNITEEDILSSRKTKNLVLARRVAMYIARQTTNLSFENIGEYFGRDHSTVLYNVNKIEEFIAKKPYEGELVEDIIKNLQSNNQSY